MEIGMKIICVKNHSQGYVKEGELHNVKDLKLCAKCKRLWVDVGLKGTKDLVTISCHCGYNEWQPNKTAWLNPSLFRPLDDLLNTEIADLMEEVNQKQPFEI